MVSVSDFMSEDNGAFSLSANGFVPRTAIVPFCQDKGGKAEVLVREGDTVTEGQVIAKSGSATVHSPIPGVVKAILTTQLPDGTQGRAAKIQLGGSFSFTGTKITPIDWHTYSDSTILLLLAEKGVVNTFDSCVSLSSQIRGLHAKSARILVVRLFDDDPSRVTETFLSLHCEREIAEGAAIIAKAMNAAGVVFVKKVAGKDIPQEHIDERLFACPLFFSYVDGAKYPCGSQRELALGIRKCCKDEPFTKIGNRDLYIDAQTALAAYNAISRSMPLTECYVHVTGECLNAAAILKVKIGTTLGDLAMQCGGFKRSVAKIVINGIVSGYAVNSLDIPVTKMVKSVSFLASHSVRRQHDERCIRCGACRTICPVGLYPDMLYRAFKHGTNRTELESGFAQVRRLCTSCGLCDAVCPSRLPLRNIIALIEEPADEK